MPYKTVGHHILYVEDHPGVRAHIAEVLRHRYGHLVVAETVAQAQEHTRATAGFLWCGFIVDHRLPDGTGLALIRELRKVHGRVPAALTTRELSRDLANACFRDHIHYVVKPFGAKEIDSFLERLVCSAREQDDRVLARMATDSRASPREAQVMYLILLEGRTNRMVASELDISLNTVKTCVRRILAKTGASSMQKLQRRITNVGCVVAP